MYDLPKGTTFEFLRDRELELLCFGPYTATLHFEGGVQIQIEGSFTHVMTKHPATPTASHFPLSEAQLMRLLLQRVTQHGAKRNATLALASGTGATLVI